MTTVTEAAKRLVGGDEESALRSGDLEKICGDPVLAQRVARRRRTDMVFVYRRRFAMVLPRIRRDAVGPLVDRQRELLTASGSAAVVESVDVLCYPDPEFADTQAVLDWAEDHLREN